MKFPAIGHMLVRARSDRLKAFSEVYSGAYQRLRDGVSSPLADLNAWLKASHYEDWQAEQLDRVQLNPVQREGLNRALLEPLEVLLAEDEESDGELAALVARLHGGIDEIVPRELLSRLRSGLARFKRLRALRAPDIVLRSEAQGLAELLEPSSEWRPSPEDLGLKASFEWGLLLCSTWDPNRVLDERNLGVGMASGLPFVLGLDVAELTKTSHEEDTLHPLGQALSKGPSYPWIPDRRFITGPDEEAEDFLAGTSRLGFALNEDLPALAGAVAASAVEGALASASRITEAAQSGFGAFGCLEYFDHESEGHSRVCADPPPLLELD